MSKEKDVDHKDDLGRRSMLKALAGIPVLGAFGFESFRKFSHAAQNDSRKQIIGELGLDDLLSSVKPVMKSDGDLIRVGMVGFGVRGRQLSKALGFMEKTEFEEKLAEQKERGKTLPDLPRYVG
jgi:hypothetical protein